MAKKKSVSGYSKYRFKNQMDYAAQLKNMMEFMGMAGELLLKTNWKDYFAHRKHGYACHKKRITEELTEFFAMSKEEKIDILLNGEKKLGRLYRDGEMATVRREWRGVEILWSTSASGSRSGACSSSSSDRTSSPLSTPFSTIAGLSPTLLPTPSWISRQWVLEAEL